MKKALTLVLATLAVSAMALAAVEAVPEIDGNTAASALALLSGALMVLRSRRRS